jgi:histidinol-phosphate aminotransferase
MKIDLSSLLRENIKALTPYASARDDFSGAASVYLDANENPFDTPYNRYPDPHQRLLKARIAELKKVQSDQVFLGNGSDEPIDLLIRAFCEPHRDNVVIPDPTYGMYAISARINDVAVKKIRLTPDFDLDVDAIETAYDALTKLIFLCSPNNPSGNLLTTSKVKHIAAAFHGLVVVDEAYIDFTDDAGLLSSLDDHPNLVVLQTASKAWGLAGIRLGMCFANPTIVEVLDRIKSPYNISGLTQSAALKAFSQEEQKKTWVKEIKKERQWLKEALSKVKIVEVVHPSDANFFLVKIKDADAVYHHLMTKGIIVRNRSAVPGCESCLRITVGTPQENKRLINELNQL